MKVQLEQVCPLLRARADQATHFAYATLENHCYAHNRVSPLTVEEQETLCLGPNHQTCRFYLAHQSRVAATQKAEASLSRMSTPLPTWRPGPRTWFAASVAVVFLCCGLLFAFEVPQSIASAINPPPTPTLTHVPTRTPTPTPLPPTSTPLPPTATATATATVPPTPTPVVYTVQPGDVLSAIATKFGVSVQAIMDANGITDARAVRVGTRLIIPRPNAALPAPQPSPTRKP
jgi:LysM repeat protein